MNEKIPHSLILSFIKKETVMKKIILILLLALLATACEQDLYTNHIHKRNEKKVSITEGVWGTVFLRTGDLLPCGDCHGGGLKEEPIQREIVIYEYTTLNEIDRVSGFPYYSKLIATTTSDKKGFFECKLAPGKYSLFIRDKERLYSDPGEEYGLFPVTVEPSKVSDIILIMSYGAY